MPVMTMKQTSIKQIYYFDQRAPVSPIPFGCFGEFCLCPSLIIIQSIHERALLSARRCIPLKIKSVLVKKKKEKRKFSKIKENESASNLRRRRRVCVELYPSERGD